MAKFETGVFDYVHAVAEVHVYFPVGKSGAAEICCRQCRFFRTSSSSCALNNEVCAFPNHYVGVNCPLRLEEADGVRIADPEGDDECGI